MNPDAEEKAKDLLEEISLPADLWGRFKNHPVRYIAYLLGIYFAIQAGKKVYAGEEQVMIEQVKGLILDVALLGQKFSLDVFREVQNLVKSSWKLDTPPANPGELILMTFQRLKKRLKKGKSSFQRKLEKQDEKNYKWLHDIAVRIKESRKKDSSGNLGYCQITFV